ncbi:hypothetical protein GGU10DRAFT_366729 [Lentinula aff. detonsa]|uniref:Uncharacterized protein n=2 Tax=Lentinula TaxID=5352 RepID=A0AA38NHP2_9AGAR|nr:hypothetical protein GGU10DRAFT_366729 [Lentinula aff. detonsa]
MEHLFSLGLESADTNIKPDTQFIPKSRIQEHSISEKSDSMLGLSGEQKIDALPTKPVSKIHSKDSPKIHVEQLISRQSEEKPQDTMASNESVDASSQSLSTASEHGAGKELMSGLMGVFHEVQHHLDTTDVQKLVGVLDSHRVSQPVQHPQPPPPQSQFPGLMNKLGEMFEGDEAQERRQEEQAEKHRLEVEVEKAKHHHLPADMFEKLGLGSRSDVESSPASQSESFMEKLSLKVHSAASGNTVVALKDQSLAGRLDSVMHHKKDGSSSRLGGGISDTIQSALGGGSAAEGKEDDLDKAIDFVQQHILRQGTQSHESILEQMKDEQIARTIRAQYQKLTGHEFPMKKGKKHWH